MRDLCSAAKQGKLCCDDLCHGNPDNTLCGFDRSLYEEITEEDCEPEYDESCEEQVNARCLVKERETL